jgi:DNA (cytosine-5)-methyltransferase 1
MVCRGKCSRTLNFGLAQGRKRIFIVGSLGNIGASKVLFEPESNGRVNKKSMEEQEKCLCITARDGQRQDPSSESIICSTVRTQESGKRTQGYIATTLGTEQRGVDRQATFIAETDADRKRKTTRAAKGLDTLRGVLIGNAVSVPVAEWIGKRIMGFDEGDKKGLRREG